MPCSKIESWEFILLFSSIQFSLSQSNSFLFSSNKKIVSWSFFFSVSNCVFLYSSSKFVVDFVGPFDKLLKKEGIDYKEQHLDLNNIAKQNLPFLGFR